MSDYGGRAGSGVSGPPARVIPEWRRAAATWRLRTLEAWRAEYGHLLPEAELARVDAEIEEVRRELA